MDSYNKIFFTQLGAEEADDGCNWTMRITYGRINLKQPTFDTWVEKFLISRFGPHCPSDVDAGDDGEGERVDEEEEALEAGGNQNPVLHDAGLFGVGEAA